MKVYIAFSKTKSLISRVIMLFTGGGFSHTFLLVKHKNRFEVIETDWSNECGDFTKKFLNKKYYIELIEVPLDDRVVSGALSIVRRKTKRMPYAFKQLLGIARHILVKKLFKKNVAAIFRKNWVCSELVYIFLSLAGKNNSKYLKDIKKLDKDLASPNDIYEALIKNEGEIVAVKFFTDDYLTWA